MSSEYYALETMDESDSEDEQMKEIYRKKRTIRNKGPPKYMAQDTVFLTVFQPCLAELLGTMILVSVGTLVTTQQSIAVALCHGLILTGIITAIGEISGAHVNPAVTMAAFIAGKITIKMTSLYVLSQITGSIIGGMATRVITSYNSCISHMSVNGTAFNATCCPPVFQSIHAGIPSVSSGVSLPTAVFTEAYLTFIFVSIILMSVSYPHEGSIIAPIATGSTLTACILAGGHITGAALNPVRSLGPVVSGLDLPGILDNHWLYWVGPMTGGIVAGVIFRLFMAPTGIRRLC